MAVYFEAWGIEQGETTDTPYMVFKYPVDNFDSEEKCEEYAWSRVRAINLQSPEVRRVEEPA